MFQVCLTGLQSHRQLFSNADMSSLRRQVPLRFSMLFPSSENKAQLIILLPSPCPAVPALQVPDGSLHHGLGWSSDPLGVSGCSSTAQQSQGGLAGNIWLLQLGLLSSAMGNLHPHVQGKQQERENTCWVGKH